MQDALVSFPVARGYVSPTAIAGRRVVTVRGSAADCRERLDGTAVPAVT